MRKESKKDYVTKGKDEHPNLEIYRDLELEKPE